ncbi:SDR family oxidoreductase [Roseomonas sp. SSH11]|uniref:SDR family oxidoreductase n=1 Tax=Pararoseomonas baculiformis TaxID=2820812 RepID=A0ABS4AC56_9PROT|nr:SDR family oxidoreductase [Pararoseomonas baculiformis]MBP0444591.1 SDR family oxidoreductase [Pararoseomonas baculiformis]
MPDDPTPQGRPLAGRRALVTGASSGIGLGVAQGLARAGAAVAVNYRSGQEAAEALVAEIRAGGGQAVALQGDVSKEEEVAALFRGTAEAFGGIDLLVANSGIQKDAPVGEMSLKDWQAVISVNLTGQFLCCREAIRAFRQGPERPGKARGAIVCMSSVHELIPWAGHVNYAASKGGVRMMMQSLAQEVARERIRVNAVAPGAIRTPINQEAWDTEEALEKLLRLIPYGRIGEPEDVARAVTWLLSDEADYITGTTLFVDGGMSLYPEFVGNG